MQKRLLHIIILLLGIVTSAQAQRYEYWLDGDYNNRVLATYGGGDVTASMDVSNLTPGLHFYNIRMQYGERQWGPVNRYLFMVSEKNVLQPTAVEYWIDDRTSMTKSVNGSTIQLAIDISQLEAGTHQFCCRVQASNGKWSETYASEFTIEAPVLQEAFIEYYIDIDPGYGNANVVKEIEQGTNKISVDHANTEAGAHVLYLRSRDEYGRWSASVARPLYVSPVRQEQFVQMEYFFDDNDPGFGKATPLSDFAVDMEELVTMLSIDGLKAGAHLLNVRGQRANGLWTSVTSRSFLVIATEPLKPFVEYFFDSDPGYGKGVVIKDIEKGTNHLVIDLGDLPTGAHVLYVRSRDEEGQWSVTVCRPFYVCRRVNLTALEYFFDNSDPGQGKATPIALPTTGGDVITFEVKLTGLSTGEHTLNVRVKGNDGLWRPLASEAFTLTAHSGVSTIESGQTPTAIFTIGGYKTGTPKQGVNIVRFKDGKTKKLIINNKTN